MRTQALKTCMAALLCLLLGAGTDTVRAQLVPSEDLPGGPHGDGAELPLFQEPSEPAALLWNLKHAMGGGMLVTFDFYTRQYMKYFFGRDYSARASSNSLGPIKSFIYSVEMREDHACLLGGTYSWTISRSDAGDKISGGIYGITAQRHPEPDGTYTYQPACPGLTADLVVEVFGAPDATRGMALRLTGSPRRSGSRELIYRSKTARARFSLDQVGHIINVSVGNSSAQ